MATRTSAAATTGGGTAAWIDRSRSLLLGLALVLLACGGVSLLLGTPTDRADRYATALWACLGAAGALTVVALLLRRPSRHPKLLTALTAPAGITLGALAFNGMLAGPSRLLVVGAALAAFVVAIAAVLVDLETSRDRPVSRL